MLSNGVLASSDFRCLHRAIASFPLMLPNSRLYEDCVYQSLTSHHVQVCCSSTLAAMMITSRSDEERLMNKSALPGAPSAGLSTVSQPPLLH